MLRDVESTPPLGVSLLTLFAVGVISLLGQVVLLRELLVAFYGSELIYILGFGFWLLWSASGVLAGGAFPGNEARSLGPLLMAAALLVPVSTSAIRSIRVLFTGTPGAYLPFPLQMAGMAGCLLPFGFVCGLLFQRAAAFYLNHRRTLAGAYAIEGLGGLAGGAGAAIFPATGLSNLAAAIICGIIAASAAMAVIGPGRKIGIWTSWILALLLASVFLFEQRLDRRLTAFNHPDVVSSVDTPYGRTTISRRHGQVAVFENDGLVFETQGTGAEEFVHSAAIQVVKPETILILGGAAEGLVLQALKHHPVRIDDVELDRRAYRVVADFLPDEIRASLNDEAVNIVFADPRRFVEETRKVYDLLISGMPEPSSGQANRYYTREFFRACRVRLSRGGVLAVRLRGAENLWSPALARRMSSIHQALSDEFTDVLFLSGSSSIVLASNRRLVRDAETAAGRWRARNIQARLVSPAWFRYVLTNDRLRHISAKLSAFPSAPNTDARPACYQFTMVVWLSRFFPSLALSSLPGARPVVKAAVLLWLMLLGTAFLSRRSLRASGVLLAGISGFAGMVLESALVLAYQTRTGVLYQDLGILLCLFMAGLALGAGGLERVRRKGVWLDRPQGFVILSGSIFVCLLSALLLWAGSWTGLLSTGVLMAAGGVSVGSVFAFAALRGLQDQWAVIAPLYGADLAGGCAGAVAAALVLLPVLGLAATVLVAAGVLAAALAAA